MRHYRGTDNAKSEILKHVMPVTWETNKRSFSFGSIPKIMGILNVTPDSFSDGGNFYSTQLAVDRALLMEDHGADIIDIGGESTRPYAESISAETELQRVLPVIEQLAGRLSIPISVDTSKASVASAAIACGAEIINDVTGLSGDPEMINLARQTEVAVCAMHMQGTPQTMQDNPTYENVVSEIYDYLTQRLHQLCDRGVARSKICLDPGIGFGKSHEHNLELLRCAGKFIELGQPILVGHSRKGFIAKLLGSKSADRTAGTLGVSLAMARCGIQILRVHDIAQTRDALVLFEASGGLERSQGS